MFLKNSPRLLPSCKTKLRAPLHLVFSYNWGSMTLTPILYEYFVSSLGYFAFSNGLNDFKKLLFCCLSITKQLISLKTIQWHACLKVDRYTSMCRGVLFASVSGARPKCACALNAIAPLPAAGGGCSRMWKTWYLLVRSAKNLKQWSIY